MKLAYFVRPHVGGTYTVFQQLRAGLAPHGIEVRWLDLDSGASDWSPSAREAGQGMLLRGNPGDDAANAGILLRVLADEGFGGFFVNVLADRLQMNLARHAPRDLLRVMIVHNITPGTYAAARAIRDHVHATVGVSARCRDDLVARHGFDPARTVAIHNAVDIPEAPPPARPAGEGGARLLFLGRVEDAAKGVLWLPDIMRGLPETVTLTVAGEGPDLLKLKVRFAGNRRVTFLGAVGRERIAGLLAAHDILVMPSRFEGFGITLVEAMAQGCVPVASRIAGVTDAIVEHGADGLLFGIGNWRQAGRQIARLAEEPALRRAMAVRARRKAREKFAIEPMAAAYRALLERIAADPPPIADPLPLTRWSYPPGMRDGLRSALPVPVKNWLRAAGERL